MAIWPRIWQVWRMYWRNVDEKDLKYDFIELLFLITQLIEDNLAMDDFP